MKRRPIKFDVTDSGCFVVTSHAPKKDGYFLMSTKALGRYYLHRRIYEECFGKIPENMQVLHSCDNNLCIAPHHLSIGTNADNVRDRQKRGRQAKGSKIHTCRLLAEEIPDIVELFGLISDHRIARMYSVSRWTIRDIRIGETWTHITNIPKRGKSKCQLSDKM